MPFGGLLTAGIIGATSIGGAIGGAVLSSGGASDAAAIQANAANQAAALQYASGQNSLAYLNYIFQQQQANQRPWLQQGQNALNLLSQGVGLTPQATQQAASLAGQSAQPTIISPPQGITNTYQQAAQNQLGQYQGKSFQDLVGSSDPNISPNAQTTQQWIAQGVPFQNVTTSDGRTVAVKISPLSGLLGSGSTQPPSGGTAQPANAFAASYPQAQIGQQLRPIDTGTGGDLNGGPTQQSTGGYPVAQMPPTQNGGLDDAHSGNMGQPVFKGGQWIPPASSGPQPQQQQASGGGTSGVPAALNGLAQPTDFSGAGALTNPYPYQFNAPQPFQGQQFQSPGNFNPPNAFAAPNAFSSPTFQGTPGFNAPQAFQGKQFQSPGGFNAPEAFQGQQFQSPGGFNAPAPYSGQTFQAPPGFVAPDAATEQNDPGYRFRLQQGLDALQSSAAARGDLYTGGTLKAVNNYAQDYASNEYQNVYNRALTGQQNNYNQAYGASQLGFGQGLAQNQNAYAQGLNTQQNQFNQALAGNQTNFSQGLAQNQNAYSQGLNTQQNQFNQALAGNQTNFSQGLAQNQNQYNQGLAAQQNQYNQAANTSQIGFNEGLTQQQNAFNQGLAGQQNQYQQGLATQQNQFNQALAGNQQQFNQGLTGYQTNYQNALTNYQQAYNQYQQGQANQFNRLASLAGLGQTAAGQLNSQAGQIGQIGSSSILGTGGAIGQQLNAAAAAQGTGALSNGNIWGNTLGGLGGLASTLAGLLKGNGGHFNHTMPAMQMYPGAFGGN